MNDRTRPDRTELPLEVLDHIDQICGRFESAWEAGARPRLEDYLGEVAEAYRSALLHDLLAAELDARRRSGERPEPHEYRGRFPTEATRIEAAFVVPPVRPAAPPKAGAGADREVLFGLLAVQTGLIDPSALVGAFRILAGDKSQSVAKILRSQGVLDTSRCAVLEGLAAEHVKLHQGDVERSLASLSAGRSTRERLEQLADPDLNATLLYVGSRPTEPGADERDRISTFTVGTATSDGQRFRVLRPHARGGLGAVFVALDSELQREVALKQILEQHADDPASRQAVPGGGRGHRRAGASGDRPRSMAWAPTATAARITPCGSSVATRSRRP